MVAKRVCRSYESYTSMHYVDTSDVEVADKVVFWQGSWGEAVRMS
jgi:hypothetical protein